MHQIQQIPPSLLLSYKSPQRTQSYSKSPSGANRTGKETHPFSQQQSVYQSAQPYTMSSIMQPSMIKISSISKENFQSSQMSADKTLGQSIKPFEHQQIKSNHQIQDQDQPDNVTIANQLAVESSKLLHNYNQIQLELEQTQREVNELRYENNTLNQQYSELLREHDNMLKAYNETLQKRKASKMDLSFSSVGDPNRTENMLLDENEHLRTLLLQAQTTIIDLRQNIDGLTSQTYNLKLQTERLQSQVRNYEVQREELEFENKHLVGLMKNTKELTRPVEKQDGIVQTIESDLLKGEDEDLRQQTKFLQQSMFMKNQLIDDMVIKQAELENKYLTLEKQREREIKQLRLSLVEKEEELENMQIKLIEQQSRYQI